MHEENVHFSSETWSPGCCFHQLCSQAHNFTNTMLIMLMLTTMIMMEMRMMLCSRQPPPVRRRRERLRLEVSRTFAAEQTSRKNCTQIIDKNKSGITNLEENGEAARNNGMSKDMNCPIFGPACICAFLDLETSRSKGWELFNLSWNLLPVRGGCWAFLEEVVYEDVKLQTRGRNVCPFLPFHPPSSNSSRDQEVHIFSFFLLTPPSFAPMSRKWFAVKLWSFLSHESSSDMADNVHVGLKGFEMLSPVL